MSISAVPETFSRDTVFWGKGFSTDLNRSLLELVWLDMQLRKAGKETQKRRQVEDAINSVRAKLPEPILGHFDRQKSR
jgi:hypothetical protein